MAHHRAAVAGAPTTRSAPAPPSSPPPCWSGSGRSPRPVLADRHTRALPCPPSATRHLAQVRRPGLPGRPALAAMSITALGAAAAVTAAGQLGAVAPAAASLVLSNPITTSTHPAAGPAPPRQPR